MNLAVQQVLTGAASGRSCLGRVRLSDRPAQNLPRPGSDRSRISGAELVIETAGSRRADTEQTLSRPRFLAAPSRCPTWSCRTERNGGSPAHPGRRGRAQRSRSIGSPTFVRCRAARHPGRRRIDARGGDRQSDHVFLSVAARHVSALSRASLFTARRGYRVHLIPSRSRPASRFSSTITPPSPRRSRFRAGVEGVAAPVGDSPPNRPAAEAARRSGECTPTGERPA